VKTREELLAVKLKRQRLHIEAWDSDVFIVLPMDLILEMEKRKSDPEFSVWMASDAIVRCVVNEEGKPVFTAADVDYFRTECPSQVSLTIVNAIKALAVNAMPTDAALEASLKN
jgi:hypothetical protein